LDPEVTRQLLQMDVDQRNRIQAIKDFFNSIGDSLVQMLVGPFGPHMIDPNDLPLPPGISGKAAFGEFIGWGTKAEGATNRAANITVREIEVMEQRGLTPAMAKTWRDYYYREWENKGADVFQARWKLMDLIYRALSAG
jgi:hypothetical protein